MGMIYFVDKSGAFYLGDMIKGDREATPDELTAYTAAQAKRDAAATIKLLELQELAPRFLREYILLSLATQFTPAQLALNAAYVKVKAFDDQIKVLRAKL